MRNVKQKARMRMAEVEQALLQQKSPEKYEAQGEGSTESEWLKTFPKFQQRFRQSIPHRGQALDACGDFYHKSLE